jgi:hypothetical protein
MSTLFNHLRRGTRLSLSYKTVILLLAICATTVGLFLAVFVGGPFARALFGAPIGFREHFTSSAALGQALLVQALSVGFAFFLLGAAIGRKVTHFGWAVWAANPISVGIGFVLFKLVYECLPSPHDLEYHHIRNGAVLGFAAPVILASCCLGGMRLSNMLSRRTRVGTTEK